MNVSAVIPSMEEIRKMLDGHSKENSKGNSEAKKVCSAIKAVLQVGKETLRRYYNKTDASEVYHIAMGMFSFISL